MLTYYIKRYPLSLLTVVAIVILSLAPIPEVKMLENVSLADKWTHMIMYAGLSSVIWFEYLRSHAGISAARLLLAAFVCPVVLGGLLELAQAYLTTYRSGEWLDAVADTIGALAGQFVGLAMAHFGRGK